jgi:hypothetical protein
MLNSIGRPTASSSKLGYSTSCRLKKDNPKTLLFESSPAIPAHHGKDICGTKNARKLFIGHKV